VDEVPQVYGRRITRWQKLIYGINHVGYYVHVILKHVVVIENHLYHWRYIMDNGMPPSYDSWRLASPDEPDYADYEQMIIEKQQEVNDVLGDIHALTEFWDDFCSDDLAGVIHDIEEHTRKLDSLQGELEELEEEQSRCKPIDW